MCGKAASLLSVGNPHKYIDQWLRVSPVSREVLHSDLTLPLNSPGGGSASSVLGPIIQILFIAAVLKHFTSMSHFFVAVVAFCPRMPCIVQVLA